MATSIETPCTKICTLDSGRSRCIGCGRTVDEIARWVSMTAAERAAIMAALPARLARRAGVPAAATE